MQCVDDVACLDQKRADTRRLGETRVDPTLGSRRHNEMAFSSKIMLCDARASGQGLAEQAIAPPDIPSRALESLSE